METAIVEFLADLKVDGRQKLTLEGHERHLTRLATWLEMEGLDWQTVTKKQIQPYVRMWGENAASTRANLHSTLRTFFRWAVEEGYVAMSPVAHLKTPVRGRPQPKSLTLDQVKRLVPYLQALDSRTGRRDRALMLCALYSGLRSSEMTGLRWASVDFAGGVINIRLSKMNHGRALPIHDELLAELERWREVQALAGDDVPVFSLDGRPLVSDRAGKICREHSKALRIPFTTHALRHTFATMLLRHSGNLFAVSRALGHLDIKQTEIYLSATVEDLRAAVSTLPNLSEW